jgi:CRP-like cAMP-binding protein
MLRSSRFTSDERRLLTSYVQSIAPLEPADLDLLLALTRQQDLDRGECFLRAGEYATQGCVVVSGLLREYFVLNNGTERTRAFVCEGNGTGSLADLVSKQPATAFIVAEEPVHALVMDFDAVRELTERSAAWLRWSVRLLELAFLEKAQRENQLLGMAADQRYAVFAETFPGLEARVAAKHIASYLGITPVHLSRLRQKRRRRAG